MIRGLLAALMMLPTWAAVAQDLPHHVVRAQLDPERGRVQVQDTIHIDGQGQGWLRWSDAFVIHSLTVDGQPQPVRREGSAISVQLGEPGRHAVSLQGEAAFSRPKAPNFLPPFLSRDAGFLGPDWLPRFSDGDMTYAVTLSTPHPNRAIAPGKLSDENYGQTDYSATFTSLETGGVPIVVTGPFSIGEAHANGVTVRTYFPKHLSGAEQGYLTDTAKYIAHYQFLMGDFPYPAFSIVATPAPIGISLGGLTVMGDRVLALPFIRTTSLPHEIVHAWWGGKVNINYGRGNWAEGLTTLLADHDMAPDPKTKRVEWLRNFAALDAQHDIPLIQFRAKTEDASQVVGYGKTAFVFAMLRDKLGQDSFNAGLKTLADDGAGQVVDWAGVEAAFQAHSTEDLSAFFTQWTTRPGAPDIQLMEAFPDASGVVVRLKQSQPVWDVDLPLRIETDAGIEDHILRFNAAQLTQHIPTKGRARSIHIDPDAQVFRALAPGEAPPILRDVTLKTDAAIWVAEPALQGTSARLGARLLQDVPRMTGPGRPLPDGPLIAIGQPGQLDGLRRDLGLNRPAPNAENSTAKVWVDRTQTGRAVLLIEVHGLSALQGLENALAHYKRRSWIVFQGARALDKGVWPQDKSPLQVTFP